MTINKDELRRLAEKYMCQFGGSDENFSDSILALLDELEAAQRDAERYRWVTENCDVDCRGNAPEGDYENLGAKIDAAMQEQKP